jgi:hypothetical protein
MFPLLDASTLFNPTTTFTRKAFHFNRIQCFDVKYFSSFLLL